MGMTGVWPWTSPCTAFMSLGLHMAVWAACMELEASLTSPNAGDSLYCWAESISLEHEGSFLTSRLRSCPRDC